MDNKALNIAKIGLTVLGIAINVATTIIGSKELDNKIAEKAQEAVANMNNKE